MSVAFHLVRGQATVSPCVEDLVGVGWNGVDETEVYVGYARLIIHHCGIYIVIAYEDFTSIVHNYIYM
jgi:hypothetical protein